MKTRKLRLIALALLVLLVFVPTTAVSAAIPSPTSDFYVADYAEVLDSDLEAYIIEKKHFALRKYRRTNRCCYRGLFRRYGN